jgi:hypothetical protein
MDLLGYGLTAPGKALILQNASYYLRFSTNLLINVIIKRVYDAAPESKVFSLLHSLGRLMEGKVAFLW